MHLLSSGQLNRKRRGGDFDERRGQQHALGGWAKGASATLDDELIGLAGGVSTNQADITDPELLTIMSAEDGPQEDHQQESSRRWTKFSRATPTLWRNGRPLVR